MIAKPAVDAMIAQVIEETTTDASDCKHAKSFPSHSMIWNTRKLVVKRNEYVIDKRSTNA